MQIGQIKLMPENDVAKPILKWAGGKGQMLEILSENLPLTYNNYIEPFFGGGALFFNLEPEKAIISDANAEIINLYKIVAENVESLISALAKYKYDKDMFYDVRSQNPQMLSNVERAARTIYLNKTDFNGLYRVNRKGEFNVPFGRYKNPKILDEANLRAASRALRDVVIINGDYLDVLEKYAQPGDLVFLDPPYMPISKYGDFKRYTANQFGEEDQKKLAAEVQRLTDLGCRVLLTNSNHPLIQKLYAQYHCDVVPTKRMISSRPATRSGEDILVRNYNLVQELTPSTARFLQQASKYPSTRYMGSKEKLLPYIAAAAEDLQFDSVLDLFSGSGTVSYLFKAMGKQVFSNDFMTFSSTFTKAMVENNKVSLSEETLEQVMQSSNTNDKFVEKTFKGLYFNDVDNLFIDTIRANLSLVSDEYERAIVIAALVRACMKKRPRGIFTYTGNRYDDGRHDLQITLQQQFVKAVRDINDAVFDNSQTNVAFNNDALELSKTADLIYMDPPYFSKLSDNDYVRRYHFVEGIARNWQGVTIQENTKTKKFKNYVTPFSTQQGTYKAFEFLFHKFRDKKIILSYSSNALPTKTELLNMLGKEFSSVQLFSIDHKYSFANQTKNIKNNKVKEYLFIAQQK
ncbi:Methyl-directed repair DNA adenine methylase [Lacticaseibacillus paracasei subsp. paracasei]|uniref:Site-specific DNA-methyltransferase (adenine-specific) n=2 Tax=Lacticaseibacillus paracasei TaxID=1597 RepID=A0AAP9KVA0_LACPA|nr:Methyl-directed repair DNA adenine methylase [Lacticaseibacillus paracasei subsp. paracasei]